MRLIMVLINSGIPKVLDPATPLHTLCIMRYLIVINYKVNYADHNAIYLSSNYRVSEIMTLQNMTHFGDVLPFYAYSIARLTKPNFWTIGLISESYFILNQPE